MIGAIHPFVENYHYEELRGGKYRFRLLRDIVIELDHDSHRRVSYRDAAGVEWMRLDREELILLNRYAWNGASPKWWAFGRWWGTPDPQSTRLATAYHDALRQFDRTEHSFSSARIDAIFWDVMRLSGFCGSGTYHGAVRLFGGAYKRISSGPGGETSILLS